MATPPTRIELCGRLGLEWDGEQLEGALPGRQGRLLFAYLVLHRDRPVRRDELVGVLWSDEEPPPGAEALLAPPLSRLRKALGDGRLAGRGELSLALPADVWVDWEALQEDLIAARGHLTALELEAAIERARAALAAADRGLLPGLEALWLDELRSQLGDIRVEALETIAEAGTALGGARLREAERAARGAVEAAPFRESAHLALMAALRAQGNSAEALRAYERVRTLLRDELGSSPGPALMGLHEELLHAEDRSEVSVPPAQPAPADAVPDRLAQAAAAPFVGRAYPLDRLRALLRSTQDGQTGMVLISGEGGIGKTRLVAQLASEAADATVLYGRCDEEQLFPFGPWIEMFSKYLADLPDPELGALLGREAQHLVRLLPELVARLPDSEPHPTVAPEAERRLLYTAMEAVVSRMARQRPLVMIIDDLHWADRSSLLLSRQLARTAGLGPVLMVGTYRDNELSAEHPLAQLLADFERERELPRIHLEGLDDAAVGALLRDAGLAETTPDAARSIRAETDGNPFFVKQLARHLADGAERSVPTGVRDVIRRRIARLPENAATALELAALVGREFDLAILEGVLDLSADELLDVLDEAVRAALLVEVPGTPGRYSFVHALVRTTLEDELTAARQARLHRRIGETIEALHPGRLDPHLDDLARHFGAAGIEEADRAVTYATQAAEQAGARLAYDEEVELLESAATIREADVPVDKRDLSRLLTMLADAKWRIGQWAAARGDYVRAATAAREARAPAHFARAVLPHAGGSWELFGVGDQENIELLEEALWLLPDEDSSLRARVLARLGHTLQYSGSDESRLLALTEEALAMARRLDDPEALVAALLAIQYALWRTEQPEVRLQSAGELVVASERLGDLQLIGEAHLWRAMPLLEMCRLEEAEYELDRHAEIADRLQHSVLALHRDAVRATRALIAGRWDEVEQVAAQQIETGEWLVDEGIAPTPLHRMYYGVAMYPMRQEQLRMPELRDYLTEMAAEIEAVPGWRVVVAWAHAQAGDHTEALAELADLRADGFARLPRDVNFSLSLALMCHIADELEETDLAAEVEPLLRPFAGRWVVLGPVVGALGPSDYSLGLARLLMGDAVSAERDFTQAIVLSERMGARPYLANSKLGRARSLETRDPAAAERLRADAERIGRELGMARLLRDAERLARRLADNAA